MLRAAPRGRTLKVPAKGTRPTSERVREALFSRLEHLGYVDGCEVLDLYAGSGALGLEAASRGATYVECVESSRQAATLIPERSGAWPRRRRRECESSDVARWPFQPAV